jgi:hypothetical protein
MTLPQPRHLPIGKMRDKRQRLKIVDDDRVAFVEVKSRCVLKYHFFVYGSLGIRPTQGLTLQGVMQFLGASEKTGRALNQVPVCLDARRIHHQRQWHEEFGDAAAVERRTDVGDAHRADTFGLPGYSLRCSRADQRFVLFNRMKPKFGSLNGRVK